MSLAQRVLAALGAVRDPELDEPLPALGFVAGCTVSAGGEVCVRLRLPTYFCAPNFAYLMVADAYDVVSGVDGVRAVRVLLEDHFAAEEINRGVAARAGFVGSFGALAVGELDGLRADFLRKAVLAGTDRVCRPLLAAGRRPEELAAMRLADPPATDDLDRLRARRRELGLPAADGDPLVVDPATGAPVAVADLPLQLRRARTTRVSLEAGAGVCRGLLAERYGARIPGEECP